MVTNVNEPVKQSRVKQSLATEKSSAHVIWLRVVQHLVTVSTKCSTMTLGRRGTR